MFIRRNVKGPITELACNTQDNKHITQNSIPSVLIYSYTHESFRRTF